MIYLSLSGLYGKGVLVGGAAVVGQVVSWYCYAFAADVYMAVFRSALILCVLLILFAVALCYARTPPHDQLTFRGFLNSVIYSNSISIYLSLSGLYGKEVLVGGAAVVVQVVSWYCFALAADVYMAVFRSALILGVRLILFAVTLCYARTPPQLTFRGFLSAVVYSISIRAGVSLSVLHGGKGAVCAKSCLAWGQGLAVGATAEDAIAARHRGWPYNKNPPRGRWASHRPTIRGRGGGGTPRQCGSQVCGGNRDSPHVNRRRAHLGARGWRLRTDAGVGRGA